MPDRDQISIDEYQYTLPESSIARYPLADRDQSRLLFFNGRSVQHQNFRQLPELLPRDSWLVFNNTRVIQARLAEREAGD